MAKRDLPSPDVLRQLLRYEPDTGKLFWQENVSESLFSSKRGFRNWATVCSGKEAFTRKDSYGYPIGEVFRTTYLAHRVIWAIVYGEWPGAQIDHINMDRADNRISNLRLATAHENMRNRPTPRANSSGYKGVHLHRQTGKWRARIRVGGANHLDLGLHDTPEAAHEAYRRAADKYHGDFARTG